MIAKLLVRVRARFVASTLTLITIVLIDSAATTPARGAERRPWLVISDIHYDPFARDKKPSPPSRDTNTALLNSLLAELRRSAPDPPVVIMTGDFLAHNNRTRDAANTMAYLARRFEATYPHAQFVITLGNNDSDCGDYEASLGGAFLSDVAHAWAPLVDRGGVAPNFVKSFSRDGGYSAKLPIRGLRAVVLNDVYDTIRYRDACGQNANPAAASFEALTRALAAGPSNERTWLVTHVPPGIDAFSTAHLAHRLLVVPFLRSGARERLTDVINEPRNRVTLVIAGHTHKFAYRLSNAGAAYDVPILLAPSVSPIFLNSASFLTLDVGATGDVGNVAETSYFGGRWQRVGDLASLGVPRFDVRSLEGLQRRLESEPALRERFATLYSGAGVRDITPKNWRAYWCAATNLSAGEFRSCSSEGGFGILTGRALRIVIVLATFAIVLAVAIVVAVVRGRRRAARQT